MLQENKERIAKLKSLEKELGLQKDELKMPGMIAYCMTDNPEYYLDWLIKEVEKGTPTAKILSYLKKQIPEGNCIYREKEND